MELNEIKRGDVIEVKDSWGWGHEYVMLVDETKIEDGKPVVAGINIRTGEGKWAYLYQVVRIIPDEELNYDERILKYAKVIRAKGFSRNQLLERLAGVNVAQETKELFVWFINLVAEEEACQSI